MNNLLICAIHRAELASVVGGAARLETNLEGISFTNADSDGKFALTIHKKVQPGNIQLRDINGRGTRIEKRDFGSNCLPDRHGAKNHYARRDVKRACI